MTDRIRIHRRAILELREAVKWYEEQEPGVGWRLWDEVFDHLDRASDRRLPGVRVATKWDDRLFEKVFVTRFDYTIYYEWVGETFLVWSIASGHRKPWYWHRRLANPKFS